ncbi:hypothetical protein P5G51_009440 [Virgibacillus sp. 179-BFC.A HS]|uniref:Uncharacterized protein n=1 Tax=Tigheibacillus jepli TaxID=3035914 RepID=A0ABU5CHA2_9BACI|nr:hypothetical protein [Virgibacillus sp. 179-BFC.A HS]MDY0405590.1 hypothetical protein [Virgibacillus sp. 179-BFC.A HS]
METLDGKELEKAIRQTEMYLPIESQSFKHLRKKAYAYGFISEAQIQKEWVD